MSKSDDADQTKARYKNDFVGYCTDILGVDLWKLQREIAIEIIVNRQIAVKSCHASGKTFLCACIFWWWFDTRYPAVIITTAPTGRQVKELLWKNIHKVYQMAKVKPPGRLLNIYLDDGPRHWGMGFSARQPESVQGPHEENLLVIVDEAAGVDNNIMDAVYGMLTSEDARLVMIGNPTSQSGLFFDAFNSDRANWKTFTISAHDTPNFTEGKIVRPYLITPMWADERLKKWGENSPMYQARVLGRFSEAGLNKIVPLDWILQAQERWHELEDGLPHRLGFDIAGEGPDNSSGVYLAGRRFHIVGVWHEPDTMVTAHKIYQHIRTYKPSQVNIDKGAVGTGVYNRVAELVKEKNIDCWVEGVDFGTKAREPDRCLRMLDQLYWDMRECLDPNGEEPYGLPEDDDLAAQLNLRSFELDKRMRCVLESKQKLRKLGKPSPDIADAAVLALYWGRSKREVKVWC